MTNQEYFDLLANVMPWGSCTCSKAAHYLPEEPAVIVSGKGCRVTDADGRTFIDFKNGLGPVSLGYAYEPVNQAIREQLDKGITYGYPHVLEAEVAKLMTEVIPCADKARFLKTGGEAVAACIKAARCKTGKDHVIQIGYNGWLNSLSVDGMILPGRKLEDAKLPGVPLAISALHRTCGWNDIEKMEELGKEIGSDLAAVIVAADYDNMDAARTFYPFLREFTNRYGAALIFDEIVTGFRMAIGGVQEYYGTVPDMAIFAKGVANGMPLSVYCGKAPWMDALQTAIVSSTYGGEALSLAAAKKVIEIYRTEDVIGHLWRMAGRMWGGLDKLFKQYGLPAKMGCTTRPVCFYSYAAGTDAAFISKMERAMLRSGVTLYHGGYVNYSHQEADIDEALERIDGALKTL